MISYWRYHLGSVTRHIAIANLLHAKALIYTPYGYINPSHGYAIIYTPHGPVASSGFDGVGTQRNDVVIPP